MRRIILFIALVALVTAEKATFENYKVYRVLPTSNAQLELLKLIESRTEEFSFWIGPSRLNHTADLMVAPDQQHTFIKLMNALNIKYEVYIKDVQKLIDQENPIPKESGFGWTSYHTLDEINAYLDSLAKKHSSKVKVIDAGKTYQGRTIKGVKVSFGPNKPGVFIEGGIHAREWIGPATVTYILNEFLTSKDPAVRKLAEAYDWYIIPSFNPDGYAYTHENNRLWRKTLSPATNSQCRGVDANRNWGYKWMHGGASDNPCSETYAGNKAFSEVETRTLSKYIESISDKLFAYVAFHSYSQLLLFPYGHTVEHLDNYDELLAIGKKTTKALQAVHGTKYVTGTTAEAIYIASGTSMDWAKAKFKLPVAYTYELRDTGKYGFLLPANQIIPNAQEVMASLIAMFEEASRFGYPTSQK